MKSTSGRGLAVIGAAVLLAIALAACGGGGSSPGSTTSSKAPATNAADRQGPTGASGSVAARRSALTACLKKYGVKLPSFGSGRRFGAGATGATGPRFPLGGGAPNGRRFPFGATGATGSGGRPGGFFPGGGGAFARNPKFAQALQKCGGFGGFGHFGATGRTGPFNFSARMRTELASFVTCMKQHGVSLPAPNLSGNGSVFGNVNQTTTAFKSAYARCKGILTYLNHPRGSTGTRGPAAG
jgi:hypothetical protein